MEVRELSPKSIWNHFEDLNAVPRPSKKEERVIQFMKDFGAQHQLETSVDHIGNVIIKKPASPGFENRKSVVLQGHLDMVHQKNVDTDFNFDQQGIQSFIEGEWVKAKGTTLGADNGMGVAAIMAVLSSKELKHPSIEALFTIDEETGMTGAFELKGGVLTGDILLNLDTEDDDELSIGCAGGVDTTATLNYKEELIEGEYQQLQIKVLGLKGGHSGMDIHLEKGNANKIMNRLLNQSSELDCRIISIDGGSLRNAIPRESIAQILIPTENLGQLKSRLSKAIDSIQKEFFVSDKDLQVQLEEVSTSSTKVLPLDLQKRLILALYSVPNGVYRMSQDIEGLVETSSNLARVSVKNGEIVMLTLQRSSVESAKLEIATSVESAFLLLGAEVVKSGDYPGWTPNLDSPILKVMKELYRNKFEETPDVKACHAGLECGILGTNYPDMDMISFGPTIRNPHSPDEKVNIKSVGKFWNFLKETLENIPTKN